MNLSLDRFPGTTCALQRLAEAIRDPDRLVIGVPNQLAWQHVNRFFNDRQSGWEALAFGHPRAELGTLVALVIPKTHEVTARMEAFLKAMGCSPKQARLNANTHILAIACGDPYMDHWFDDVRAAVPRPTPFENEGGRHGRD